MASVTEFIRHFGILRLVAILGVTAGVAAMLFGILVGFGTPGMSLLYANLDMREAGAVTERLDQAGIQYELKGDGSTIMVERDKVLSARVMLSAEGLPTSGSVGYELFDKTDSFGQTEMVQNLNRVRALEGELARTIRSIRGVTGARVHLVLPQRRLFDSQSEAATASIVVGLAGQGLTTQQVSAMRNLVSGATPGLSPSKVVILDEKGRMLSSGLDDGQDGALAGMVDDREAAMQDRIRAQVLDIVENITGPGKAKVQVAVDMDFNRISQTSEIYDPDGQVVRSQQSITAEDQDSEGGNGGPVTAGANIPEGALGANGGQAALSNSARTEETINYEISKTTKTELKESGTIQRLSIAVAVDGATSGTGENAEYTPRSAEEMQQIENLVRTAVGFDEDRGDQISVVNVRFASLDVEPVSEEEPGLLDGFNKNDIMRAVELGILSLMAIILIFTVLRPLLKGLANPVIGVSGGDGTAALAAPGGGNLQAIAGPQGGGTTPQASAEQAPPTPAEPLPPPPPSALEKDIEVAKVEGLVKAASVNKVAEYVKENPQKSVAIMRSWLHKDDF